MNILRRIRLRLARGTPAVSGTDEINLHFKCPVCAASQSWHQASRAQIRENSVISVLVCKRCNEKIVGKVPLIPGTSQPDRAQAAGEFRTLTVLLQRFPQDEKFGTLIPLAHLEQRGILITRKFNGNDLKRWATRTNGVLSPQLCRAAGHWLRKLHDACPHGCTHLALDVESKTRYLEQRYSSALRGNIVASAAYEHLLERANSAGADVVRTCWGHGDYKPENVLHDGHKCIGLDTQLKHDSAIAYDLASFLNHLLIDGPSPASPQGLQIYTCAKEQVIAGYGNIDASERRGILWAQLYFMLCYWSRYQMDGGLLAAYKDLRLLPLLRMLASQL